MLKFVCDFNLQREPLCAISVGFIVQPEAPTVVKHISYDSISALDIIIVVVANGGNKTDVLS